MNRRHKKLHFQFSHLVYFLQVFDENMNAIHNLNSDIAKFITFTLKNTHSYITCKTRDHKTPLIPHLLQLDVFVWENLMLCTSLLDAL